MRSRPNILDCLHVDDIVRRTNGSYIQLSEKFNAVEGVLQASTRLWRVTGCTMIVTLKVDWNPQWANVGEVG